MGQKNQLFVTVNTREELASIGVEPAAAAAFRAIAILRAAELARAHATLFNRAWREDGVTALPPRWRGPWPRSWRATLSWRDSRKLALAGLACVHPRLERAAALLVRLGRVRISYVEPPQTRPSRFGPPLVVVRFTRDSETPLVLAHELGHATQMCGRRCAASQAPPQLVASEVAAHVAERGFHRAFLRLGDRRAAAARVADDMLTMLVRHPARDLLEHGDAADWPDICAAMAPGHAWAQDPPPYSARAAREPLSTLGYAMAATLSVTLFHRLESDRDRVDAYFRWVRKGPSATLQEAAELAGGRLDDPSLYDAGYSLAIGELDHGHGLT